MKFYLTSRFSRREELRGYRNQLLALGHEVLGSWLDSSLVLDDDAPQSQPGNGGGGHEAGEGSDMSFGDFKNTHKLKSRAEILRAKVAQTVFAEISDCEGLIAFTDAENNTHGAALAEFGMALGQNKKLWIVGKRQHVLHYHDVPCFPTWGDFLTSLAAMEDAERAMVHEQRKEHG
jgi:hypothetical protein